MKCEQKITSTFQARLNARKKHGQNVAVYEHRAKPKETTYYRQKPVPRMVSKSSHKHHIKSLKNKLFISEEYLPLKTEASHQHPHNGHKNSLPTKRKDDESTASHEFKIKQNHHQHPNPQYFGASVLSFTSTLQKRQKNNNHNHKTKQQKLTSNSSKMIQQLKEKINTYSRLNSLHQRESASLRSEINEKQMHRLRTIQSTEKLRLAQDIISIQRRLLNTRFPRHDLT